MVAKQIMVIQGALAAGMRYTVFEGRTMYVNATLALYITMNPMYEHRSVLPSNLKVRARSPLWRCSAVAPRGGAG